MPCLVFLPMCRNYNPLFKSWWEKAAVTVSPSPPFLISKPFPGLAQGEGWCLIKHRLGWANNSRALLDFLTSSPWPAQLNWCSPPGWTLTPHFWKHFKLCWLFKLLGVSICWQKRKTKRTMTSLKVRDCECWEWEHWGCLPLSSPPLAPSLPNWSLRRGWWKWGAG